MPNAEPTNNSQPEMETQFIHDLPYDRTEWGQFYKDFKNQTQGQLQKYILKTENERKEWFRRYKNSPYENLKMSQHIFYCSHYNAEKEEWETPAILLKHATHFDVEESRAKLKIGKEVFVAFFKRQKTELEEVKAYYQQRKEELAITQKAHHKEHANEVIECPICSAKVGRTSIARHKKTNKRCLYLQNSSLEKEAD
jgi:hypothetical protein